MAIPQRTNGSDSVSRVVSSLFALPALAFGVAVATPPCAALACAKLAARFLPAEPDRGGQVFVTTRSGRFFTSRLSPVAVGLPGGDAAWLAKRLATSTP